MSDMEPCECGFYHRYGTTDPEHKRSFVACVNTLVPEVDRLRRGLRQIVEGNYPADALNAETWAQELLFDSRAVEWDDEPTQWGSAKDET